MEFDLTINEELLADPLDSERGQQCIFEVSPSPAGWDGFCDSAAVAGIQVLLQTNEGTERMVVDGCESSLFTGVTFEDVGTGPVRAGIELVTAGTDANPVCHVFWSERVLNVWDREPLAVVTIPTPDPTRADPLGCAADTDCVRYLCENTQAACEDGIDDDGDAAVDCLDPDCADFCPEP